MIIGAIDVGSNSVKLLVAEVHRRETRLLAHRSAITRLGRGLGRTGRISPEAQDRTLEVLREFRRVCGDLGAGRVVAAATEAVRTARNGRRFAERCRKEAGIPLHVVSGREEARLAFLGATWGRRERRLAAIDVGGGSTELMLGRPGRLETAASLGLGAVALTEAHLALDPPAPREREALLEAVTRGLAGIPTRLRSGPAGTLLGIGGTCVNVARMAGSPEGRPLARSDVETLFDRLSRKTLEDRKKIQGLDPERADIIVAGAAILLGAMRVLGFKAFTATVHGLRRGLVLQAANQKRGKGDRKAGTS
jgi:exopolyphosphatase/guanosine-5'-triphosphate,3'-diphosphate pyrophosphatase